MSHGSDAGPVSDAVLYEGYLLYPYDPGSVTNRYRSLFGTLFPEAFCIAHASGDTHVMRLQCIANVDRPRARLAVRLRFLQLHDRGAEVRNICSGGFTIASLAASAIRLPFSFPPIDGAVHFASTDAAPGAVRIDVRVENQVRLENPAAVGRDRAMTLAIASPHLILSLEHGAFVSAIDPPAERRPLVESCRNEGTWPVLLGPPGSTDTLLAAPIILPDHPQIAPESPGDFFDGTEMDEMLTLRILTLTDEEKARIARADDRGRSLLERTERLGLERLAALHGAIREPAGLPPGTRVVLHPRGRADIMDLALEGRSATVVGVERDLEGRIHVAVTVDDDPGRDLGVFGHRFFFRPDEVERA